MAKSTTIELPLRLSVKEFAKQIYGNEGGVRNLIFWGIENGFNKCIRRIGKKIFIDVAEYYTWQDEINGIGGTNNHVGR